MYYKVKLQSSPKGEIIIEEIANSEAKGYTSSVYSYHTEDDTLGLFAIRETADEAKQALKKYWRKRVKALEDEISRYQEIAELL